MLSAKTCVASMVVGAMSAEAFLAPAMPARLSAMATTRGNLSPQAGLKGVRMTASSPSDVSEDPEL